MQELIFKAGLLRLNRGSYMGAHVLLKLLNELRKSGKMLYPLFATSLINSKIQEHEC